MKSFAGALLGVFAYASVALAGTGEDACGVASSLVQADAGLTRVAAAIKNKSLTIVVEGTASSALPGPNGTMAAYPARLEAVLQKKLQGISRESYIPREAAADCGRHGGDVFEGSQETKSRNS